MKHRHFLGTILFVSIRIIRNSYYSRYTYRQPLNAVVNIQQQPTVVNSVYIQITIKQHGLNIKQE